MNKSKYIAVPALALGAMALTSTGAFAQDHGNAFHAQLDEINGSGGSGSVMIELDGNQATVTQEVSGLAEEFDGNPYPHVQHVHIVTGGEGVCPSPDADENGDGIVDTVEGQPSYGEIGTTLSTEGPTGPEAGTDLEVAGMGGSFTYERTFEMNDETVAAIKDGKGTVVVHGLDPAGLDKEAAEAKSNLVPELPLAATAPALCGEVTAAQMDVPEGNPETGGGNTAGMDNGMIALGGGLVLAAAGGGAYMVRRRRSGQN